MGFETYIKSIQNLTVNGDALHWRAKNKSDYKKGLQLLTRLWKEYGLMEDGQELIRTCSQVTCLNPLHYSIKPKCKIPDGVDADEVEALEPLIDLEELELRGFNEYLNIFNLSNPLPARNIDFFVACNRRLKKAKKELLAIEVLDAF